MGVTEKLGEPHIREEKKKKDSNVGYHWLLFQISSNIPMNQTQIFKHTNTGIS